MRHIAKDVVCNCLIHLTEWNNVPACFLLKTLLLLISNYRIGLRSSVARPFPVQYGCLHFAILLALTDFLVGYMMSEY